MERLAYGDLRVEIQGTERKDEFGAMARALTVLREQARERERAEEALRLSHRRSRDLAEISSDWIWESDAELRFQYFSDSFSRITGVSSERMLGKTRREVARASDRAWSEHLADLDARRPFRDFRYEIKDDNGEVRHFSISGAPAFDELGNFEGYRGTGSDRTESERLSRRIARQNELFELMNSTSTAANQSTDSKDALQRCLPLVCEFTGWSVGHAYTTDTESGSTLVPTSIWHQTDAQDFDAFKAETAGCVFETGIGLPGRVHSLKQPVWVEDVSADRNLPRSASACAVGLIGGAAFPVMVRDEVVAVLEFFSTSPLAEDDHLTEALNHVCAQVARVVERARAEDKLKARRDALQVIVDEATAKLVDRADELTESRNRLLAAIEAIPDGFGVVDSDNRVVMANRKLAEFFPDIEEFIARKAHVSEVIESQFPGVLDTKAPPKQRFAVSWSEKEMLDGRWVRVLRSPIPGGGGIAVYTDITEARAQRLQLEQQTVELQEALSKEKELSELQQQFVSMVSHEFRTPLAIIDASAGRLIKRKEELSPEEVIRRTDKIRRAVDRMTRLMESTLAASRLGSGKLVLTLGDVDLRGKVLEVCERQQDLTKSHHIITEMGDLPDAISADAALLDQVLTNLLSNAVKYAPNAPEITVTAKAVDDVALISVKDSGLGIDEDDLPNMFNRFFRAKTSTGIPGTGIGLNIVRQIVELHGGTIEVESRKGEGSTFTVSLPLSSRPNTAENAAEVA